MIPALLSLGLFFQGVTQELIEHAKAGVAAQQQRRYDLAIQEFRKVVELQPNGVSGHANLGDAYFQSGNYEAAIPELKRALELNPNLTGTHQVLGVALLVQGNAAEALPHLEKARTPELLGLAYLETGRFGSAIMALLAALERQPDDPDLLYYFGRSTALASKRTVEDLARINPNLLKEKEAAAKGSQPLREVGTLQMALAKQPDDPNLLFDFHQAAEIASKEAFDKLVRTNPSSARAHQVAAEKLAAAGRLPAAEKEYAESLRLKPYTAGVHLALGKLFIAEGDWRRAVIEFRLESQLRPLSAEVHFDLAELYRSAGKPAQADRETAEYRKLINGTVR